MGGSGGGLPFLLNEDGVKKGDVKQILRLRADYNKDRLQQCKGTA